MDASNGIRRTPAVDQEPSEGLPLVRRDFVVLGSLSAVLIMISAIAVSQVIQSIASVPNAVVENSAPENSIAVLPFVNMSGIEENEYFADGISEELLNELAGLGSLQVAARTSSC